MNLISFNIALKIENNREIVDFLNSKNTDFIVLQEVVRPLEKDVNEMFRSGERVKAGLEKTYPFSAFVPLWRSNAIKEGGKIFWDFGGDVEQGLEIFSKFPITHENHFFFHGSYEYIHDWGGFIEKDHGRALQQVTIKTQDGDINLLNIHGIWTKDKKGDRRTINECSFVAEKASMSELPTMICGDFNVLPDTESISILDKKFRNLITENNIITTLPDFDDGMDSGGKAIDYIFVNDHIKVNDFKVIETEISDHYPLMIDFDIIKR